MQIPLSLYIHIPWCEKKCPYCDFNSHLAKTAINQPAYVEALIFDLEADLSRFSKQLKERQLKSIFFGGGTPSLFSADSINSILLAVQERIDFVSDIEITLEANPGSAEADKFIGFKQAGVNRLSIGVQSFNGQHLSALGRVHNADEATNAAAYARQAGFDNFNLDLMFGLPEQSLAQAIDDIETAISLKPNHLSCYQLTIEPNTLFHHQPPVTPDDETLWDMQEKIQSALAHANYKQYEVSAYARHNFPCQHNLNYWSFGDYLGIGAGAHGKISSGDNEVSRYWKIKHPASYLQRSAEQQPIYGGCDQVDAKDLPFEFMLNALRLTNGFDLQLMTQRTGQALQSIQAQLDKHLDQDLISIDGTQLTQTSRGKAMVNSMLQDYLPEPC